MLEIHISDISLKKVNLNIIRSDTHRSDICLKTFFGVADVIFVTIGGHVKILPALWNCLKQPLYCEQHFTLSLCEIQPYGCL